MKIPILDDEYEPVPDPRHWPKIFGTEEKLADEFRSAMKAEKAKFYADKGSSK